MKCTRGYRNNCRQTRTNDHNARVRVTKDWCGGSGKLTVKLSWEVVGSQAVKKVISDGSWAGLLCVMSSLPNQLARAEWFLAGFIDRALSHWVRAPPLDGGGDDDDADTGTNTR